MVTLMGLAPPSHHQTQQQEQEDTFSAIQTFQGVDQFVTQPLMQNGGVIEDDRGQWAHPGKVTRINSPNITMRGVVDPLLGISDQTGEYFLNKTIDFFFAFDDYAVSKNQKFYTLKNTINVKDQFKG